MRSSDWSSDVCSSDLAVFFKGGACYDCHTIFAPQAGKGWRVAAVDQTPRYLQKGWFDHDAQPVDVERAEGNGEVEGGAEAESPAQAGVADERRLRPARKSVV